MTNAIYNPKAANKSGKFRDGQHIDEIILSSKAAENDGSGVLIYEPCGGGCDIYFFETQVQALAALNAVLFEEAKDFTFYPVREANVYINEEEVEEEEEEEAEYELRDRYSRLVAQGEVTDVLVEDHDLLTDADLADQAGEWLEYNDPILRGEQREVVWQRDDGTSIVVGTLTRN